MPPEPKRSPLKHRPLRNPGESLEAEFYDILATQAYPALVASAAAVTFAAAEWWRWYRPTPPAPWIVTIAALLVLAYSVPRISKAVRRARNVHQGMQGEKAVGQQLEELRAQGCQVFHDIPGDGFNLDHVVVSARGIYVIETKTLSKLPDSKATVVFDGQQILLNGREPLKDYGRQAYALRDWLRKMLLETTGRQFSVRAVLVFPGWWVECKGDWRRSDLWVLNPGMLAGFLAKEPEVLKPEDVALVGSRIAMHVRAHPD